MEVMHACCTQEVAAIIARQPMSAVKAVLMGRVAVVTASAWQPITVTAHEAKPATHFVRAEFFPDHGENRALEGTLAALPAIQQMLDRLEWHPGEPSVPGAVNR